MSTGDSTRRTKYATFETIDVGSEDCTAIEGCFFSKRDTAWKCDRDYGVRMNYAEQHHTELSSETQLLVVSSAIMLRYS